MFEFLLADQILVDLEHRTNMLSYERPLCKVLSTKRWQLVEIYFREREKLIWLI